MAGQRQCDHAVADPHAPQLLLLHIVPKRKLPAQKRPAEQPSAILTRSPTTRRGGGGSRVAWRTYVSHAFAATSHSLAVLSAETERSLLLSGDQATHITDPLCAGDPSSPFFSPDLPS
jgi:hypothetical protein